MPAKHLNKQLHTCKEQNLELDTRMIAKIINTFKSQQERQVFNDNKLANARLRLNITIKNFTDAFETMQVTEMKILNLSTTANLIQEKNEILAKIYETSISNLTQKVLNK